ncbi:mechanosensitive ion channel family protein [Crocosphaera sp. Alani8]|uniref:mechanosensitive ion channel family protein n=1 Tax=Crocosphaera sp. Alani8 TaxID=3038952 RepID=UPI00313F208E
MLSFEKILINWPIIPVSLAIVLVIIALPQMLRLLVRLQKTIVASETQEIYQRIINPDKALLQSIILLLLADLILLVTHRLVPKLQSINIIEFPIGISVSLVISWIGYRLVERFFTIYLTEITQNGQKLNSDLLIVARGLTFSLFLFIIITIFSQAHEINIFGLIASLGISGVAIAFAAQKTLEQLLGGIVLYLDRPFMVDDYIGLPDGTFGKVESIGLRSTKIRISGKGTLMVVPNNYLTQINIENFTGANKLINIIKVSFFQNLSDSQKSFVSQLIAESSLKNEVDSRNLHVDFEEIVNNNNETVTQAQIKNPIHQVQFF